jgi:hypothetical protein
MVGRLPERHEAGQVWRVPANLFELTSGSCFPLPPIAKCPFHTNQSFTWGAVYSLTFETRCNSCLGTCTSRKTKGSRTVPQRTHVHSEIEYHSLPTRRICSLAIYGT